MNKEDKKIDWISFMQSLQSIAQTGLAYSKNEYDLERYQQILELVSGKYAFITGADKDKICATLFNEIGYATPKICVRAFIYQDREVLLVKERSEELWSLPGGWADVNLSPTESIIKEVKEETGLNCHVERLLAFWDKRMHDHPPHWPHTYLAFYLCRVYSGIFQTSHEISEVAYFDIDNLPELSTHRVTEKQIKKLMVIAKNSEEVSFD